MKRVLVTGGTGSLGKWVVNYLSERKYSASILTSKENILPADGVSTFIGDLADNTGLGDATAEADVIIHCASNPRNFERVDVEGTQNLLKAINKERTKHFIYISIVGVDKSDYPYYKAKLAVEKMIAGSSIPFTILRTTQFHGFVLSIAQTLIAEQQNGIVTIPPTMRFQSIAIREVAQKLVDLVEQAAGLLPEFGGPEVLFFEEMVRQYLHAATTNLIIKSSNLEGDRYQLFRSGVNLCPQNKNGKITWREFVKEKSAH